MNIGLIIFLKLINIVYRYARRIYFMEQTVLQKIKNTNDLAFLEECLHNPDPHFRRCVAFNENLDERLQRKCSEDVAWEVRDGIAQNKNLCHLAGSLLVFDPNISVRKSLAENEHLNQCLYEILANDDEQEVRLRALRNKGASQLTLFRASFSLDPKERAAVCANESVHCRILRKLYDDPFLEVRRAIAGNKKCPRWILNEYINDPSFYVRYAVVLNPNATEDMLIELAEDEDSAVLDVFFNRAEISSDVLSILSRSNDFTVRCRSAEYTNLYLEDIIRLSEDDHYCVRLSIAQNPSTPYKVLVDMYNNEKEEFDIVLVCKARIGK